MKRLSLPIVKVIFLLGVISAIPTFSDLEAVEKLCDDAFNIFMISMNKCKPDFDSGKIKNEFGINIFNTFKTFIFAPCFNEMSRIGCILHLDNEGRRLINECNQNVNFMKKTPSEMYSISSYSADIHTIGIAFEQFIAILSLGEPSTCGIKSDIIIKDIDEILTDEDLNQPNKEKDEASKFCDQVFREIIEERRGIKSHSIKVEKPKKDKSKQLTPRIKSSLESVPSKKKSKRRDQGAMI